MPLYDADDSDKGAIRVMRINRTTIGVTAHSPALRIYNVVVDVIRIVKVITSTGEQVSEVVLAGSVPAGIKWKRGSEKVMFDKDTHWLDATLRCRAIAGVTVTDKDMIKFAGESYEIVDVVDVRNLGRLLKIDIRKIG